MIPAAVKVGAFTGPKLRYEYAHMLMLQGPTATVCLPLVAPLRVLVRRPTYFEDSIDAPPIRDIFGNRPPTPWTVDKALGWLQVIQEEGSTEQARLLLRLLVAGAHRHNVLDLSTFKNEEEGK